MSACAVEGCPHSAIAILPLVSRLPILGMVEFDAALCQGHLDDVNGRPIEGTYGFSMEARLA